MLSLSGKQLQNFEAIPDTYLLENVIPLPIMHSRQLFVVWSVLCWHGAGCGSLDFI